MPRSWHGAACILYLALGCSEEAASPIGPVGAPSPSVPPPVAAIDEARERSEVRDDEVVVLFPVLAHQTKNGDWKAELHGWIYEPERDGVARAAVVDELRDTLQIPAGDPGSVHFRRRTALFLADNERGKNVEVRVAGSVHRLPPSGENGHFRGEIRIPSQIVEKAASGGVLEVETMLSPDDDRRFVGRLHLVAPDGVLLISDIDDTIKVTNVRDRTELMRRTFLRELEAVPNLAPVYRRWLGDTGHLHFVSSSPWQLQGELAHMAEQAGFPPATYSLKTIRLKDSSLLSLFTDPEQTKPMDIEPLLERFPDRRVILAGDSGEKDPEIYGAIYRAHPDRIERIVIRDVTKDARSSARYEKAFREVPDDKWQLFEKPEELR